MGRKTAQAEAYDRALAWRVPDDAPSAVKAIADEALQALVEVMRQPDRHAREKVAAASRIRDEVCGLLTQRSEISGSGGAPMAVSIRIGVPTQLEAAQLEASDAAQLEAPTTGRDASDATRRAAVAPAAVAPRRRRSTPLGATPGNANEGAGLLPPSHSTVPAETRDAAQQEKP